MFSTKTIHFYSALLNSVNIQVR